MPFIGNQPALSYTSFAKQDFTTSATTSYTLDNPVANANELALFINFVRQEPTASYSASGTTLTLTEATSVGDDMYCVFLGKAVQTVNPPNASVGTSQLVDNGVTTAKIANDAVTFDKMSGQNYPGFSTTLTSNQGSVAQNTWTKVNFDSEILDSDSAFNTTDKQFVVPANRQGKYLIFAMVYRSFSANATNARVAISKNNSRVITSITTDGQGIANTTTVSAIMDLAVADTIHIEFFHSRSSDETIATANSQFYGYRIGD